MALSTSRVCLTAFDWWKDESHRISPEHLALFRIVYSLFLLFLAFPVPFWTEAIPAPFFTPPPGPLALLSGFPPVETLRVVSSVLVFSVVALFWGYHTRLASYLTGVLLIFLIGADYCLGKIDHNRHFLFIIPLILADSGWGNQFSLDQFKRGQTVVNCSRLTILAFVLGCFFMSAGLPKLLGGWLDTSRGATWSYTLVFSKPFLGGEFIMRSVPPLLWKLMDYMTVIFEVGFLLTIISIKGTRLACYIALLFHFGIYVLLGISFFEQYIMYPAFWPLDKIRPLLRLGGLLNNLIQTFRPSAYCHLILICLPSIVYCVVLHTVGVPTLIYYGWSKWTIGALHSTVTFMVAITICYYIVSKVTGARPSELGAVHENP